jgi:WD40 repeat protein
VLARTVHFAHQHQIVHRDLKPANVLLSYPGSQPPPRHGEEENQTPPFPRREGGSEGLGDATPKIADFSLAKELDADGTNCQTRTGEILGTPSYMAPEQASGKVKEVGPAADIYALGAILYELLTGRPPFTGESTLDTLEQVRRDEPVPPRRLQPRIPRDLETICLKCLAKSPGRRYADAQELAGDLHRFLDGKPIRARPVGRVEKLWRWCRRNPAVAGLTTAVVFLLVGLTAASLGVAVTARAREEEAGRRAQEAQTREREQRRETLVQQIQLLRAGLRGEGWRERAWNLVKEAVRLGGNGGKESVRDEAATLLAGFDGRPLKEFHSGKRHVDDVSWLTFSPDGNRLLMGGVDGVPGQPPLPARLWDRATDSVRLSQQAGAGPVAFRRDGTPLQVVPQAEPLAMRLWDVAGQRWLGACRFHDPPAALMRDQLAFPVAAVSTNGERLAAAAGTKEQGVTAVWEVASGKRLLQLPAVACALALAPDGSLLAAADRQGEIAIWSLPDGTRRGGVRERLAVYCLAFSPDGRRLACGGEGGALAIWDWEKQRVLSHCRGSDNHVYGVTFNPDGSLLASTGRAHVSLWDAATGTRLLSVRVIDYGAALAFSPDGQLLALGCVTDSITGRVEVHRLENGRGIRALHGLGSHVCNLAFSRDGRLLAALAQDWQVGIWEMPAGRLCRVLDVPPGPFEDNTALAFSPDSRYLAFAAGSTASLWDVATGAELWRRQLPPALADALAFDATGARLLSFRYETVDGTVPPYATDRGRHPRVCRLRDLLGTDPHKPLAEHRAFDWRILWTAADPEGRRFYAGGSHGEGGTQRAVKAFAALTGEHLWSLPARAGPSRAALEPAGDFLAVDLDNAQVTVVAAASGKEVASVLDLTIALGPGAHTFAVGIDPPHPGLALYRRRGQAHLVTLRSPTRRSSGVSPFSPDGRFLTWGDADGTISVCDVEEVRRRLAEVGLGW